MTRALLGCTIVLMLGLTAHAQGFDPLYKPELGDTAVIGCPIVYNPTHSNSPKVSFFGVAGYENSEIPWNMNEVNGHMEDSHTYLAKPGKRYHLHAGLRVKIVAKCRTVTIIFNAQRVLEPWYEVEIAEGELAGIHLYIGGLSLQQKSKSLQNDWDEIAEVMHTGVVLEDDNPKLAINQYESVYSLGSDTRIREAAKRKLVEAGVPLPPTLAEIIAKRQNAKDDARGFGKPLAAPKEDSEDLSVDLIDTTWQPSETGNYIYIYVKIRNTSGTTLKVLRVTATLEQQNNSIISTAQDIMEPMTIAPNGTALAKLSCRANPPIHHYNLTFENADFKEVKFKNRTR